MKRRMKIMYVLALFLIGISSLANAEIFTVELPEFLGPWDEAIYMKPASFDFGTSFLQIYDVRIQLEGAFTAGLAHGDGLVIPEDVWSDVPGAIDVYMDAGDGLWGTGSLVYESPLFMDESLEQSLGATWDFLLDGTDQVNLSFGSAGGAPIWIIVNEPTVDITDAYLVVNGIVPEPATIFLFAIGAMFLRTC
jgi:hypothetical protein